MGLWLPSVVDSTEIDELLWSWTLWFDVAKSIILIHNSDDIFRFLNDKIYLLVFFLGDIYSHLDSLDYIPNITPESFLSATARRRPKNYLSCCYCSSSSCFGFDSFPH